MSSPNALLFIYFYFVIIFKNEYTYVISVLYFNGGDQMSVIVISSINTNESQ